MYLNVIFLLIFACIGSAEVDADTIIKASQSFAKVAHEMGELGKVAQDASKVLKVFSTIGVACGPIGAVFGSLSSVMTLFAPDPNEQLMNAITQLKKEMEKGFNDIKERIDGINERLKRMEIELDFKAELAFVQKQETFIDGQMGLWQEFLKSKDQGERMKKLQEACHDAPPYEVIKRIKRRLLNQRIGSPNLFESLLGAVYLEKWKVEAIRDRVTYLLSRALTVIPLCGSVQNSSRSFIDENMRWGLTYMQQVVNKVNGQVNQAYHRYKFSVYICQSEVDIINCEDGAKGTCEIEVRISAEFKNQNNKYILLKKKSRFTEEVVSGNVASNLCIDHGTDYKIFDGTNNPFYYMLWRGGLIKYTLYVKEQDSGYDDDDILHFNYVYVWPGNLQTALHHQRLTYWPSSNHNCEDSCDRVYIMQDIIVQAYTVNFYNGTRWKLVTKTGSAGGAGTPDGNVHIIILGSNGESQKMSEKVILDDFDKSGEFQVGKTSEFDFWTTDVGQVTKIKFGLENKKDEWQLASVPTFISAVLASVKPHKTYRFDNINKLISGDVALTSDTSSKPKQWTLTLRTGMGKQRQRLKMGAQDSTELNADIYIVITGSNGVSEMVMPDSGSGNDFGEGATDTFTFGTDDIGELKSVTFGIANGNGGWQMESAELALEGTNDKYSFDWNKLLHVDDETVEREYTLVPDLEHQWGMQTKTGLAGQADTQGKVWTILKGNLGESPKIYLSHPDAYEKGAIDLFHFGTDDLGELDSVQIGIESNDNWFVEWVSLTLKNEGKKFIFHIDQWLDSEDSEIELEPLDNLHVDSGALLSKPNHEPHIVDETDEIPPVLCHSEKPGQFGEFETYYIHSGYPKPSNAYQMDVLQVPVGRIDDGSPLEHCTFVESERQRWKVMPAGDDAAYIISAKTDKVLEVPQNSEAGNRVQLSELSGFDNQKWRIEPGYYATEFEFGQDIVECDYCKIINVETGLALDMMEKDSCGSTVQTVNYPPEDAEPIQTQQWYFNLI